MQHNLHNLVVRPLFYDALSGEFSPPNERRGRTRTLGRLACTAFTAGSPVDFLPARRPGQVSIYSRAYSPSWAPGIEATVVTVDAGQFSCLVALKLTSLINNYLRIIDDTTLVSSLLTIERPDTTPVVISPLETQIDGARHLVTEAAAEFFRKSLRELDPS